MYVCVSVGTWKKINMMIAGNITGVASHGKHTRATEHVKKLGNKSEQNFPPVKFGPQKCPANGYGNFVPQFFHMFGDSVYAYHDFATRKNVGLCPLPGS